MSEDANRVSPEPPSSLPPRPPRTRAATASGVAALALVAASAASLEPTLAALFEPGAWRTLVELGTGFVPPTHDAAFVRRLLGATLETFAMSLVGTTLGALAALPLALASARLPWRRERRSEPRKVRSASVVRHPIAALVGPFARATLRCLLVALRSVPELVWAALLLVVVGIGPASGTLALALHTAGVLARLQGETLENLPPETAGALHANGASGLAAFVHGALPLALPRLASWTLYRWESNIRIAALLGLVGAGGLGQTLHVSLSLFRMHDAASVILATIALVAVVDAASFRLRRRLNA